MDYVVQGMEGMNDTLQQYLNDLHAKESTKFSNELYICGMTDAYSGYFVLVRGGHIHPVTNKQHQGRAEIVDLTQYLTDEKKEEFMKELEERREKHKEFYQ